MLVRTAVDLFAGAGGATRGLRDAGFRTLAAVENDRDAAETYRRNNRRVRLFCADIREVDPLDLLTAGGLSLGSLDLLKACPPCQGFSSLANGRPDHPRNDLVLYVSHFVAAMGPKIVLLENVPGLARDRRLPELCDQLVDLGYRFHSSVMNASEFGTPQRRKRFILYAVRRDIAMDREDELRSLLPSDFSTASRSARQALSMLDRYRKPDDPLNVHRRSSPSVASRIASIPVGGSRFDLPEEHQLDCHRKMGNRSASSAYGRVRLDEPAPTMTTRCTTPACGRFVHPTEDRGLTLREAATFQTFPVSYKFSGHYESIERQIGNAVPVRMAKGLGLIAKALLERA